MAVSSFLFVVLAIFIEYFIVDVVWRFGYKSGFVAGVTKTYRYLIGENPSEELLQRIFLFKERGGRE